MSNIVIIGAGSMGTALAKVSSRKENKIILYSIEQDVISDINSKHSNKKYLPDINLPVNISATGEIAVIEQADIVFTCVPTLAVETVAEQIKPYLNKQIIVSTTKGLSPKGEVLTHYISELLNYKRLIALSGPSISHEIAKGQPTRIFFAGDLKLCNYVKEAVENDRFIVEMTTDITGVQLLAFFKNILAIVVGMCRAIKTGDNFKAAIISKAYREFYYQNITRMRRHTFVDAAGMGDLFVTSISEKSRNQRFGYMIAKGATIQEAKNKIGQAVEGYDNFLVMKNLKSSHYFEQSFIDMLDHIFHNKTTKSENKKLLEWYLRSRHIKNVILDWGGVVTKNYFTADVAKKLAEQYGYVEESIFKTLEKNEKCVLLGTEKFKQYFSRIKKNFPKISYSGFQKAYKDSITWNKPLLEFIKNRQAMYDFYILSDNYSIISRILRKSQLKDLIKGMVFSNEVGITKPNAKIYEHTLEKFNLREENSIFIDDKQKNLKAAKSLNLNTLKYSNYDQFKKDFGTFELNLFLEK